MKKYSSYLGSHCGRSYLESVEHNKSTADYLLGSGYFDTRKIKL